MCIATPLRLFLLPLLLAACAVPATPPPPEVSLRLVSYNIHAGNDAFGEPSLDRVVALLDSLEADIVLLQEVDRETRRSGGVDQLEALATGTGLEGVYGRAIDFDGGEYGNAVLSRWPVRSARTIRLEVAVPEELADRYYEARSLMHLVVETPLGVLHLLNTHLDHHPEPIFRQQQLFRILAYLSEEVGEGEMVVLGGDLNAEPDAVEIRAFGLYLTDPWEMCGEGPGHTFRADNPVRRIDYLLLRGLRCTGARVLESTVSDHRPLVVDVVRAGG